MAPDGHARGLPDRGQPHRAGRRRAGRQLLRELRLRLAAQLQPVLQRARDEDDRSAVAAFAGSLLPSVRTPGFQLSRYTPPMSLAPRAPGSSAPGRAPTCTATPTRTGSSTSPTSRATTSATSCSVRSLRR
jgi:hypothetical protein